MIEKEYILSIRCRAIMIKHDIYLVYTPDENLENVKNVLPPRFYKLRTDKVPQKNLSCSCGFAVRQKMPCRHMLQITSSYSAENFHPRWLKMYQYAFERPGYDRLTELYRNDHFSRNIENDETIYFSSIVQHSENKTSEDPIMINKSTQADKDNLLMLHSIERNKNIAIRGFSIEDQVSTNLLPHEYSNRSMVVNFSQETQEILNNDEDFTRGTKK